jgi:hypothetical protein
MPGSLSHLSARFFDVLQSKPLSGTEVRAVEHWLGPALAVIFFDQPPEDQRHGYHAALVVVADHSASDEVIEAALLHDVGKRHAGLGIVGRSIASVLIRLGAPLSPNMAVYKNHGLRAARELASAGANQLSVEFAEHHHESRPSYIDPTTWSLLQLADQPPKPRSLIRTGITSTTE